MITAGIDVGCKTVKAVILDNGKVVASGTALSNGFDRSSSVEQLWDEVLKKANLSAADVNQVIATGTGKWDVPFASDHIVELVADVKAALWLFPSARTLIDIGVEQARVAKFDAKGKVLDYVLNEKCAAGLGAFAEAMARTLEVPLEEMSALSLGAQKEYRVNEQCAIYAGIDVVSLIHNNTEKADIARAINNAIATKLSAMVGELTIEPDVVLIGGGANNTGLVSSFAKRLGTDFLIPEEPVLAGALGAALIATG